VRPAPATSGAGRAGSTAAKARGGAGGRGAARAISMAAGRGSGRAHLSRARLGGPRDRGREECDRVAAHRPRLRRGRSRERQRRSGGQGGLGDGGERRRRGRRCGDRRRRGGHGRRRGAVRPRLGGSSAIRVVAAVVTADSRGANSATGPSWAAAGGRRRSASANRTNWVGCIGSSTKWRWARARSRSCSVAQAHSACRAWVRVSASRCPGRWPATRGPARKPRAWCCRRAAPRRRPRRW
jgi:hypothetical protein